MNLFSSQADKAAFQSRIKEWVREALGLDDEISLTVNELRCPEPDCPDIETVIGVLLVNPRRIDKYKVLKEMQNVTAEDVAAACTKDGQKHGVAAATVSSHPRSDSEGGA